MPVVIFKWFQRVAIMLLLVTGLPMLFAPRLVQGWMPFEIGSLTTSTLGAWFTGIAGYVWFLHRHAAMQTSLSAAVQASTFGFGLLAAGLIYFSQLHPGLGTWLYLASLATTGLAGLLPILHALYRKLPFQDDKPALRIGWRVAVGIFLVLDLYISYKLLSADSVGYTGLENAIFPEAISEPVVKTFGMFYLSVGVAAGAGLLSRSATHTLAMGRCGLFILSMILLAAGMFPEKWSFAPEARHYQYLGVYLGIAVTTSILLLLHRGADRR